MPINPGFGSEATSPTSTAATAPTVATSSVPAFINCAFCGSAIEANARFCEICGRRLSADSAREFVAVTYAENELPLVAGPTEDEEHDFDVQQNAEHVSDNGSAIAAGQPEERQFLAGYVQSRPPLWKNIWLLIPLLAFVLLAGLGGGGIWYWRVKQKSNRTVKALPTPNPTSSVARAPEPPQGMVYIPGGTFSMGRDDGDEYERPAHDVSVDSFFLDKFEVTCEEYQRFVDQKNYPAPSIWQNGKYPAGSGRLPVTGVSWTDATAYAQWANKRLPTEEEWEFAARGYDGRRYPWGNEWNPQAANAGTAAGKLMDVGSHPDGGSAFGIQDMSGNAWEWTSSQIQAYHGSRIKEDDLPEAQRRNLKVIRGGSYQSNLSQATATYRMGWPAQGAQNYAQSGFRCAKDISR